MKKTYLLCFKAKKYMKNKPFYLSTVMLVE